MFVYQGTISIIISSPFLLYALKLSKLKGGYEIRFTNFLEKKLMSADDGFPKPDGCE
jgi:hypothetical protein